MKRTLPILGLGLVVSIGAGCPSSDTTPSPEPSPVEVISPSNLEDVTVEMVPVTETEIEVTKVEVTPAVTPEGLPHSDVDDVDHLSIARAHLEKGELEDGLDEIERAIFDDPESFEAYFLYGTTQEERGELETALWGYQEARNQRGDDLDVLRSIARIEMRLENFESAQKVIEEMIDFDEDNPVGYRMLARTFSKREMWSECIDANTKAIEKGDESPFTFNNMGYAQLVLGQYLDAVESFEDAVGRDGATHIMWNNLGIAFEKSDDLQEAYSAYKKALELRPKYVNAKVNLDRLTTVAAAQNLILVGSRVAEVETTPVEIPEEKDLDINDLHDGVDGE